MLQCCNGIIILDKTSSMCLPLKYPTQSNAPPHLLISRSLSLFWKYWNELCPVARSGFHYCVFWQSLMSRTPRPLHEQNCIFREHLNSCSLFKAAQISPEKSKAVLLGMLFLWSSKRNIDFNQRNRKCCLWSFFAMKNTPTGNSRPWQYLMSALNFRDMEYPVLAVKISTKSRCSINGAKRVSIVRQR